MGKIQEALEILREFGLPRAQQNERSALTLLAVLNLSEDSPWASASKRNIRIHDILLFIQKNYKKKYAENTRETIRRQTLHQFEQAGLVIRNPDDQTRPTNSPKTAYTISDEAWDTIKVFNTQAWKNSLRKFLEQKGKLSEKYEKAKIRFYKPFTLPGGKKVKFSPGKHNALQISILQKFRPKFCPNTKIVYVGDTARKMLYVNKEILENIRIPITKHEKLPDVVLYEPTKNVLFLIEAVTAHGPVSPKRQIELEETLKGCKAKRVYISAFPDFREFKRHTDNIAWDTEVWIENMPEHVIHFNGEKFFNVYE
ncbi:MAG: BsuBI/PstI family type II restriction endonuclease [Candidatus Paceibacterota bacterium]